MRGSDERSGSLFSYVDLEARVRVDHPCYRAITSRWTAPLIEAWASIKSFRRKDGRDKDQDGPERNAERSFHKEKRSNETHASMTDPEARLYKKGGGQPAKLSYIGHALMENRNGIGFGRFVGTHLAAPCVRTRTCSMPSFFAPRASTSVASYPLYILSSRKMWQSASHCVDAWHGMLMASSA